MAAVQHCRNLVETGNCTASLRMSLLVQKALSQKIKKIQAEALKRFQEVRTQTAQCEKKSLFFLIDKNSIFLQTPSSPLHNELCRLKVHQTAGRLGKHWLHFYADLPFHPSWNGFWCYSDMKKRQDLIESGRLPRSLSEIQTLSCHFTISSYKYPAPSQHRNSCL